MLRTLADALWVSDEACIITTASPPYYVVHTNIMWRNVTDPTQHDPCAHPAATGDLLQALSNAANVESTSTVQIRLRNKSGEERLAVLRIFPLCDQNGARAYLCGLLRDDGVVESPNAASNTDETSLDDILAGIESSVDRVAPAAGSMRGIGDEICALPSPSRSEGELSLVGLMSSIDEPLELTQQLDMLTNELPDDILQWTAANRLIDENTLEEQSPIPQSPVDRSPRRSGQGVLPSGSLPLPSGSLPLPSGSLPLPSGSLPLSSGPLVPVLAEAVSQGARPIPQSLQTTEPQVQSPEPLIQSPEPILAERMPNRALLPLAIRGGINGCGAHLDGGMLSPHSASPHSATSLVRADGVRIRTTDRRVNAIHPMLSRAGGMQSPPQTPPHTPTSRQLHHRGTMAPKRHFEPHQALNIAFNNLIGGTPHLGQHPRPMARAEGNPLSAPLTPQILAASAKPAGGASCGGRAIAPVTSLAMPVAKPLTSAASSTLLGHTRFNQFLRGGLRGAVNKKRAPVIATQVVLATKVRSSTSYAGTL